LITYTSAAYFVRRATRGFQERPAPLVCPVPDIDIDGCFERTLFLVPEFLQIHNGHSNIRKELNQLASKVARDSAYILNIQNAYKTFWSASDGVTMRAAILPYIAFDLAFCIAHGLPNPHLKAVPPSGKARKLAEAITTYCSNGPPAIIPSMYYMAEELVDQLSTELAGGNLDRLSERIALHANAEQAIRVRGAVTPAAVGILLRAIKSGGVAQNNVGRTSFKVTHRAASIIAAGIKGEAEAQSAGRQQRTLNCLQNLEPDLTTLFVTDPNSGRRNGQAVSALPIAAGNLI